MRIVEPGFAFNFPDDTTGWVFYGEDGSFRANTVGTAVSGHTIFDL